MSVSDFTTSIPERYKCCSMKLLCAHPDGPILPSTLNYFQKEKRVKDGLTAKCKYCSKKENKVSYDTKKDIYNTNRRNKYKHNPEKDRERVKKWRAENPKKINSKKYREKNKDRLGAYNRQWHKNNRDKHRAKTQRHIAKKLCLPYEFDINEWYQCLEYWHGRCAYCGNPPSLFDGSAVLDQEHFVPLNPRYELSIPNPGTIAENILPACRNCNRSKNNHEPRKWLTKRFGQRKANQIAKRIFIYFDYIRQHKLG